MDGEYTEYNINVNLHLHTYKNGIIQLKDDKLSGGIGFSEIADREGWTTNLSPNISGDANAVKGDIRFLADMVFPNTLRAFGKETRSQFNSALESLIYEPLLTFD